MSLLLLFQRIASRTGPPGSNWILATGSWDNNGVWIDTEPWKDGA